jgi:SAM-dependent methyltransferase
MVKEEARFDLSYSLEGFDEGAHRDSQYLYRAIEDTMVDLGSESGGRVLDVACGTGKLATRIAARGCWAIGVEPSREMIGLGRLAPGQTAEVVRGIAEALPFADESFDRVTCQGSLDHFADPYGFMQEAGRVTKRDGRIIVALANFESLSCRLGRAENRLKRRLKRPIATTRPYWQIPEDHTVKGDLAFVRSLGGSDLVLDQCFGISLLWLFSRYGKLLDVLPKVVGGVIWRTLDRAARGRPQHADLIISIWRNANCNPANS